MFKPITEYLITAALVIAAIAIIYSFFAQSLTRVITRTFGQVVQ